MTYILGISVVILIWYLVQSYLFTKLLNNIEWGLIIFVCLLMYALLTSPYRIVRIWEGIKYLLV